ncbi:MAG: hypothetical protein JXO22_08105, partial [Phycisphaerae bacterium]|nr:hypothetical protein [Phycisphaerae bacterium]
MGRPLMMSVAIALALLLGMQSVVADKSTERVGWDVLWIAAPGLDRTVGATVAPQISTAMRAVRSPGVAWVQLPRESRPGL